MGITAILVEYSFTLVIVTRVKLNKIFRFKKGEKPPNTA